MKDVGFYVYLKSNEMIENSKFYFYNLRVIDNFAFLVDIICYYWIK